MILAMYQPLCSTQPVCVRMSTMRQADLWAFVGICLIALFP